MFYTYILRSKKHGRHYIGSTTDLRTRVLKHNQGGVRSTKGATPWEIIYYEAHRTKALAILAERHYKTGQGRRQLDKKLGYV